ncbi:DUF6116 family protein [Arenimonas oryziterrae]|uniref:Uncharacterized protein n=1 Tax=Arenimonas oryziterrae DSM 21050 = YC6267 TaxID=1121015 RepID=A0A091AW26_9GAMM|nr:DUF6116 family protein [Arenimonas oryziterrae]KFN42884.1 hypothetical protein N789_12200 [Arenimonas oryziterrae DSM 21050 = YC6267]
MASPFLGPIVSFASRLRYPTLFKIVAFLFVADLIIPFDDFFPPYLLDEILLGLGTLLLANWKNRKDPAVQTPDSKIIEGEVRKPD